MVADVQPEGTFTNLGNGAAVKSGTGATTLGPNLPTITVDEVRACRPARALYTPSHRLHRPTHAHTPPPPQSVYGIPNTRDGNTVGEKMLGAAAALAAASGSAQGDGACRVANAAELRAAITVRCGY